MVQSPRGMCRFFKREIGTECENSLAHSRHFFQIIHMWIYRHAFLSNGTAQSTVLRVAVCRKDEGRLFDVVLLKRKVQPCLPSLGIFRITVIRGIPHPLRPRICM